MKDEKTMYPYFSEWFPTGGDHITNTTNITDEYYE